MRILFLINSLDYGGAENYVIDLANVLTRQGHWVMVAAAKGRGVAGLDPKVCFVPVIYPKYFSVLPILNLIRMVKQNRIEVIHANQLRPIEFGVSVGWLTRTPVVATLHGKLHRDLPSKSVRRKLSRLIVICDYWLELIRSQDINLYQKSVRIFNGIKIESIANFKGSEPKLVYASRLNRTHSKIIKLLISEVLPQLVSAAPDFYLEVIGDGDYYSELNTLANQTNQRLGKAVIRMVGYRQEIRPALATARVVLGVGRVALEALASGIPVIAANHRHFGGLVSQDNISYFIANNFLAREEPRPDAARVLAEIKKVLTNREDWQTETKLVQKIILQEFDLYKVVKQVLALYRTVARLK